MPCPDREEPGHEIEVPHPSGYEEYGTIYAPCPGCPKCDPQPMSADREEKLREEKLARWLSDQFGMEGREPWERLDDLERDGWRTDARAALAVLDGEGRQGTDEGAVGPGGPAVQGAEAVFSAGELDYLWAKLNGIPRVVAGLGPHEWLGAANRVREKVKRALEPKGAAPSAAPSGGINQDGRSVSKGETDE